MKHERRIPAWLLRDLPALGGLFACFWLFVIPLITEGFRLIRGGKPCQRKADALAHPLLAAEATLAYALWREAYRRLGYNPRDVKLELADLPPDNIAVMARIRSYMDQVQNLSRAAAHYTDVLRRRWAGGCPLRRAARATSPGLRPEEEGTHVRRSLSSSGVSRGRWRATSSSRDGGGSRRTAFNAQARAPPTIPRLPIPHSLLPRWRTPAGSRPHAPFPTPPTQSRFPRPRRASCVPAPRFLRS